MGHGLLMVLVGPSGAGKNTLIQRLLRSATGISQMPTATTRPRRDDELEGREHFFLTDAEFDGAIRDDEFLEWQPVHIWRYGSLRARVEAGFAAGADYVSDLDVLGAMRVKELYPQNVLLVFVLPPPPVLETLEARIRQRGVVSEDELRTRLARVELELSYLPRCDYAVINDDAETAADEVRSILVAARCRRRVHELSEGGRMKDEG